MKEATTTTTNISNYSVPESAEVDELIRVDVDDVLLCVLLQCV